MTREIRKRQRRGWEGDKESETSKPRLATQTGESVQSLNTVGARWAHLFNSAAPLTKGNNTGMMWPRSFVANHHPGTTTTGVQCTTAVMAMMVMVKVGRKKTRHKWRSSCRRASLRFELNVKQPIRLQYTRHRHRHRHRHRQAGAHIFCTTLSSDETKRSSSNIVTLEIAICPHGILSPAGMSSWVPIEPLDSAMLVGDSAHPNTQDTSCLIPWPLLLFGALDFRPFPAAPLLPAVACCVRFYMIFVDFFIVWCVKLLHVCTLIQVELNNNTNTANNNQLQSSRGHDDGVKHEGPDRHASSGTWSMILIILPSVAPLPPRCGMILDSGGWRIKCNRWSLLSWWFDGSVCS